MATETAPRRASSLEQQLFDIAVVIEDAEAEYRKTPSQRKRMKLRVVYALIDQLESAASEAQLEIR